MIIKEDQYGTRIYPFAESEDDRALASAGYIRVPARFYTQEGKAGSAQFNIQLDFLNRAKWEKLQEAVNRALEIAEQQAEGKP